MVLYLCHLDLIIHHVCAEIPVGLDRLHLFSQFVELSQR